LTARVAPLPASAIQWEPPAGPPIVPTPGATDVLLTAVAALDAIEDDLALDVIDQLVRTTGDGAATLRTLRLMLAQALVLAHQQHVAILELETEIDAKREELKRYTSTAVSGHTC
jgi:hypothetical protein